MFRTYQKEIKIGFLFNQKNKYYNENIGFAQSAGVVPIALKEIMKEKLLPANTTLSFYWKFDNCAQSNSSGQSYDLMKINKVNVIFGPSCLRSVLRSSYVTVLNNIPLFVWGFVSSSQLTNHADVPNVFSLSPSFYSLSYATIDFLKEYNWTDISFIAAPSEENRCSRMFQDFLTIMDNYFILGNLKNSLITNSPPTKADYDYFFSLTKPYSRIILSCFDLDEWKRDFLLYMYDNGYNNTEWVHINMETKSFGFMRSIYDSNDEPIPFYKDTYDKNDHRDNDVFKMAQRMFSIDTNLDKTFAKEFTRDALTEIQNWPFFCNTCDTNNVTDLSTFAADLYDAIYLWANLLNTSISMYGEEEVYSNYSLLKVGCNKTFVGIQNMKYDGECNRLASFILKGLNKYGEEVTYINYTFKELLSFEKSYKFNESQNLIFENWDFQAPLNTPLCGFNGKTCPINFFKDYLEISIIVIVIIVIVIIIIKITTIYAIYRFRKKALEALSQWKIPQNQLIPRGNNNTDISQSVNSFQSGKTSKSSTNMTNKSDSNRFMYVYYKQNLVAAEKHTVLFYENKDDMKELTGIFLMSHSNINKFYGMSVDGSVPLSIWKYCKRGSIFDFLQTDNSIFDSFFLMCLIKDIIEGLFFIHNSNIKFHGQLTSKNCFINDRWEVKISNFDLKSMRIREKLSKEKMIWMAPEHIRNEDFLGSPEGDIYSFSIICSEIIGKTTPFDIEMKDEYIDEIIYFVKKSSTPPKRPEIVPYAGIEINSAFLILVKDCWSENTKNRPNTKHIRKIVTALQDKTKKNLMDHAFSMLENYASTLREEVDCRTTELVDEKKKSDLLLKRMLPSAVAEKLKLGKTVEPENFDSVTVFFADVVKFTILSSKCSPLQIINLVNELYTAFDNIIESLDVYKVETIGDGYLCVSGIPIPNGIKHGKEIALLALGFMDTCSKFKIPFLPDEKISLRIGCNSGPCVAGVVGLSMPRYCLFGDTVNTASRMESNGKGGRIHISESYYNLLREIGGFQLEERGNVIIKGKGVMTTYWLNGMIGNTQFINESHEDNDNDVND